MLYIHKPEDLNPETAQKASAELVRQLRMQKRHELAEAIKIRMEEFRTSETDIARMAEAEALIPKTLDSLSGLKDRPGFSKLNLMRAYDGLKEIIPAISANTVFAAEIKGVQTGLIKALSEFIAALSADSFSKQEALEGIDIVISVLLRRDGLFFNSEGVVSQASMHRIITLSEMFESGSLFHTDLFSHKKRHGPDTLLPAGMLLDISRIKDGFMRAHQHNMRMVEAAVVISAFKKVLTE